MNYTPDTLRIEMDQLGRPITKRRLLDWVQKGLLPHPQARGRGRGQGKVYGWTEPDILHRAVDVYELLAWHRRVSDLFLPLWVLGYDVPVAEVRARLRQFIDGLDAGLNAAVPRFGDRSDLVSDLLAAAQERMQQADAVPMPVLAAFLQAVVDPDTQHWQRILDDLVATLTSSDGEQVGWPDARGAATLVSFAREQLSVPRLLEIIATVSDTELEQVHHDLRRVVQSARAVAQVGTNLDPWLVTRVLVHLGTWGGLVDLALRRAGRRATVDRLITHVVDGCQQLLTDPRLRVELQHLRAQAERESLSRG